MNSTFNTTVALPGYRLVELLYCGSKTVVYRGIRLVDDQAVALKLLQQEYPTFHDLLQFRNQYTLAKNLDIPGIIRPYSLEPYRNSYALVMEDFGGVSLRDYTRNQALGMAQVWEIALQVADILHGLHADRVIHKDIKPANILIHPETKQVKLIDFSIASLLPKETPEIKNPNRLEGTLAYISPEQTGRMNRGIDYRSDFYALGVTLFELLAGQLPYQSDDPMELVHCHIAKQPPSLTQFNIPEAFADIVMKLMAKNAEERYQSALGLKHDVEICLHQLQETGKIEEFEIGQRDISDRFNIPDKLYGRETEVQTLLEAFDRVAEGVSELMLVAGFSGIGKTAVVNEVHKPIVRQRGYFIKGKFDQFNRNIPFFAFVQAFRDLMGQLLSESDAQLATWRAKILDALGENGQVIVDVIPELERIIGQQPPVPELSGSAAQNRFNLLFEKFIEVFTTPEHPLVMFLDDLQWADSASLNLLNLLMSKASSGYLLIVGAYRDNEVFPGHPLMLTLEQIQKAQSTVNTITLSPLVEMTVNQLVADTLSCPPELAQPLTQLVYQKTKGNPFFTTQFLKALHEEGWIQFQPELGYWQCDMSSVRQLALTDDVVEFMALQLQKLPAETQEVLKLAACIGNQFDLNTLAIVSEKSPIDTATNLWKALQEGLILPISETYKFFQANDSDNLEGNREIVVPYKFLHDRVQQAAYSLITDTQKPRVHYKIGKLLLRSMTQGEREEQIFVIVNQLNQSIELVTLANEQHELAQLNFLAGKKAKAAIAYGAAIEYFSIASTLLTTDCWERQYDLALALYQETAEAAYLNGDFVQAAQQIELVLRQARTLPDKIKVYEVQIQSCIAQHQLLEAIKVALQVLQLLGIHFPEQPNQSHLQQALENVRSHLSGRQIESLIDLPVMDNPFKLAAMKVLSHIVVATLIVAPDLFPLVVCQQVELSINSGNSSLSASGYANYGLLSCAILEDISTGYEFGKLALALLDRFQAKESKAKTLQIANAFVKHWKEHLKETLSPLLEGYVSGLETGDLEYAAWNLLVSSYFQFLLGRELISLSQEMSANRAAITHLKQYAAFTYHEQFHQSVLNLLGQALDPCRLVGDAYDEEQQLAVHQETNDRTAICILYMNKLLLCYWFGNYTQAVEHATQAEKYLSGLVGLPLIPIFYFYQSLASLAAFSITEPSQQDPLLQKIKVNQEKMQQWAYHAPGNCLHRFHLVEAEKHRVLGNKVQAIEHYDFAISLAKENGYIQEEALANELAAKFYLDWGKEKVAAGYMLEAYYCYAKWGALAKTSDLEKRYPQLLTPIRQTEKLRQDPSQSITQISTEILHATSTGTASVLDLAAVIKASQTLSSEIALQQLLSTLMRVVMENAGASRGALILLNDQQWQVVVSCGDAQTCILESTPLDESPCVPLSIINRVKHTKEVLVLHAAPEQSSFTVDPYLMSQRPQSLLCSPLLNQGKLLGIVYLENNLATGAFSRDRVELLNLICSQAAISLQNARLYQQLEDYSHKLEVKVAERTAQLQAAQKQMVAQEKLAALGTLTAGIAHELRNPLNFVNNYAESSVELTLEVLAELENPTPDQEYIQELLTDLKDNAATIHRHGQRAENIIRSMMEHAKSGSDSAQRQTTNLNQLLSEAIQLVYHSQRALDPHVNITFDTQYDDSIGKLEVIPNALSRALINLLDNACYAVRAKQRKGEPNFTPLIEIATTNCGNCIEIRLRDNGCGMTSEIQEKIFEPFFTTKPTGEGTGLGLSLTHDIIVEQHGGTLSVESSLNCYTEFRITLPLVVV